MSSKSIFIILSYTVSKLVHFFETQCSSTAVLKRQGDCDYVDVKDSTSESEN